MKNKTWILCEAPKDRKIVKCKWVYTTKRDADGRVIKYKARMVAKDYSQEDEMIMTKLFRQLFDIVRFVFYWL